MKTILVPVDFSDATELVLETTLEIGKAFGSRLILFHGVEPKLPSVEIFPGLAAPGSACMAVPVAPDLDWEERELEKAKQYFDGSHLEVRTLMVEGEAISSILEESKRADLIVMGSHGHGALYNFLAGSVAQGVLRSSKIPVLVVPGRKLKVRH